MLELLMGRRISSYGACMDMHAGDSSSVSDASAQAGMHEIAWRLDQLTLTTMAMWEMIRDKTDLTEEDIIAKVQEIDLRDGNADGKLKLGIKTCPACNRPVNPRHARCLYCGAELKKDSAFEGAL